MIQACIAALLALSSAACVAFGDVLQQRVAYRFTDRSFGHIALLTRLVPDRQWQWGALLLAASVGLQAAALSQGSVLLVQALLVLSVLFALVVNARLDRRAVTRAEWTWAGLLTAAVALIVTVGNPQAGPSSASGHAWVAVAAVLGPLLAACVVAARHRRGATPAMLLAFVAGSLWGIFAVLTRQVASRFGDSLWELAGTPEFYGCLLTVAGGFVFGQAAFRAGPLTASMPTLEVSQPIVAAALGVTVLGETFNTGRLPLIALSAAALVMVAAIVKLARLEAVAAAGAPEPVEPAAAAAADAVRRRELSTV